MPNRDGTGPEGKGPKTGRGLGQCALTSSAQAGDGAPRGAGRGQGLGLGRGRRPGAGRGVQDTEK